MVAVQGERASNSALAAEQYFAAPVRVYPCTTFAELFATLRQGHAPYGMAPVENSLTGSIHPVWDLLAQEPLPIVGELYFRVRHCLIGHPGARLEEIRRVHSHAQALAQCATFLSRLRQVEPCPAYDTAGAVQIVKKRGNKEEAAIAPEQAGRLHGMEVLARDIQTRPDNYTRFLVLGPEEPWDAAKPYKTTLICTLPCTGAPLAPLLASLNQRHFQVYKIESRKLADDPWGYLFYVEFQGHQREPQVQAALAQIRGLAPDLHLIGSYPAATLP
jgi:prephenate dehydratase